MSKDADYWRGQGNRQQVADIEESQMKLLQEQRMDINTQLAGLEEIAKESSAQFADNHTKSAAELDRLYITLSSKLKKSLIENQQKQSRWDAKMQRKIGNDQAKNRQEMFGAATDAQITLSEFNRNTNIGSQGVQNEQERSMAEINARNARDFQGDQFDYKKSLPPTPDQDVARATADLAINETQIAQSLSDAGVISIDDIITSMEDVAGDIGAAGWLGMNSEKNQSNAISVMNQYNNLVNGNAGSYWRNWFDSQPQWNKFIQKINDGYLGSKQPPRAQPNVPPKANGGVFGPLKKTFSF